MTVDYERVGLLLSVADRSRLWPDLRDLHAEVMRELMLINNEIAEDWKSKAEALRKEADEKEAARVAEARQAADAAAAKARLEQAETDRKILEMSQKKEAKAIPASKVKENAP